MLGQIPVLFTFVVMFIDLNEHPEIPKNIYMYCANQAGFLCLLIVLVAGWGWRIPQPIKMKRLDLNGKLISVLKKFI